MTRYAKSGRIRRFIKHPLTPLLVCTCPIIAYNVAAYFDPRGIGGDREATFPGFYLTVAIVVSVGTLATSVAILARSKTRPDGRTGAGVRLNVGT